jgi:26S proteasome regulatory subunit T1
MSSEHICSFLDAAIRNRIAVRLIAEQHIVLSRALQDTEQPNADVGVVDMALSPVEIIRMCASFVGELCEATLGAAPPVVIDGATDATFACVCPLLRPPTLSYPLFFSSLPPFLLSFLPSGPPPKKKKKKSYVPVHMEYILTEILKNAFRATVEHHHRTHRHSSSTSTSQHSHSLSLPPVLITIVPPPRLPSFSTKPATLSLRIRDQGGGVPPANMARIFSYAFTTAGRRASTHGRNRRHPSTIDRAEEEEWGADAGAGGGPYAAQHVGGAAAVGAGGAGLFCEMTGKGVETGLGTIAGLGFGLPMSRLYAQ